MNLDITEVTKQRDLSGFYRHLYRSTMDEPGKAEDRTYSKREQDVDRHRERDKGRDNRGKDDRHKHRSEHERRRDQHGGGRSSSHRYHPYTRKERDHHGRSRGDKSRSHRRSRTPARKPAAKSSTSTTPVKSDGHKENSRPASTKTKPDQPPTKLSEHKTWKKRTTGENLTEARQRYLERKEAGVVCAIVVKEK